MDLLDITISLPLRWLRWWRDRPLGGIRLLKLTSTIFCVLSLLIFVASIAVWIRSYSVAADPAGAKAEPGPQSRRSRERSTWPFPVRAPGPDQRRWLVRRADCHCSLLDLPSGRASADCVVAALSEAGKGALSRDDHRPSRMNIETLQTYRTRLLRISYRNLSPRASDKYPPIHSDLVHNGVFYCSGV